MKMGKINANGVSLMFSLEGVKVFRKNFGRAPKQ
jgi:hypothetical protein